MDLTVWTCSCGKIRNVARLTDTRRTVKVDATHAEDHGAFYCEQYTVDERGNARDRQRIPGED